MKYQKHYLSDSKSPKYCPLQQEHVIQCDSFCAWFDHEEQDCRKILALKDIVYEMRINHIIDKDLEDAKREFNF